jgi:sugar O-acyltransferase (sialic acid O-acetyltransferase NeuD family)
VTGLVIIGAGSHGREVAEIARQECKQDPSLELLGFIDEDPASWGESRDGLTVLGGWSWFDDLDRSTVRVVCAVGAPAVSRRLAGKASSLGLRFARVISPFAIVSPLAQIGEGVTIFPQVVVNTGTRLGDHAILNVAATLGHDCDIGAYSFIAPGAHLAGSVHVGEACWIGIGASIIQGRSIGDGTVVGAGAAVVQDIPPNMTVVGVPARAIRRRGEGDA